MGNRGCLHDEARRIVRPVVGSYRAWVTCVLSFKGRRQPVMRPGRYTELFFLGVFVAGAEPESAVLVWRGSLWAWSPEGYTRTGPRPTRGQVTVLTPRSTVNAIAAGYIPMVHATAET